MTQERIGEGINDPEERAEVSALLDQLPTEHPARQAFAAGADAIRLTHLVLDHPQLIEPLKAAWLAGYNRLLRRSGGHFRP